MKRMNSLLLAMATAATVLAAPAAFAQSADPGAGLEDTQALDDRLKLYWGQEMREVEVIQPRLYRKDQRHEFTLFAGFIPNDPFNDYFPLGGRWDYFFAEDFGVEIAGAYLIGVSSELDTFLNDSFEGSVKVEVKQTLQWHAGASLLWSPIHGKLGIFTEKLTHFDIFLAFGVGALGTDVQRLEQEESKVDIAGHLGLGFRFFLSDSVALRADYRQFFYAADGGGLSHPSEITIGVSLFTAAPE